MASNYRVGDGSVKVGEFVVTRAQLQLAEQKAKGNRRPVPEFYRVARDLMGPDPVAASAAPRKENPRSQPQPRRFQRAAFGDTRGAVAVGQGLSRVIEEDKAKSRRAEKLEADRKKRDRRDHNDE